MTPTESRAADKKKLDAERKKLDAERKKLDAERKKVDAAVKQLKTQATVHTRFSTEVEQEKQQLDDDLSKSMRTLREFSELP